MNQVYGNYTKRFCKEHGRFFVSIGNSFDCPECIKKLKKMADITMCEGLECPLKEKCYRYTATADEYWQAYFTKIPYDIESEECEYYWEDK